MKVKGDLPSTYLNTRSPSRACVPSSVADRARAVYYAPNR